MTSASEIWLDETIAGLRALSRRRLDVAAAHWTRAAKGLDAVPAADALGAAGRSNAGVGALLLGRVHEAEACFAAAEAGWWRALDDVDGLDVAVAGRSSSFHFRLAARHHEVFAAVRRRRYRERIEAALAITRFNRALARGPSPSRDVVVWQAWTLRSLLSHYLGHRAPDVRLLSAVAADNTEECDSIAALYAEKADAAAAMAPSLSAGLGEVCGRLEVATALTVLLAADLRPDAPAPRRASVASSMPQTFS